MHSGKKSGKRFLAGPGNNSIIQDDAGVDWIVYHAIDSDKPWLEDRPKGMSRRPMCIDPLLWDSGGWPYVANFTPSLSGKKAPVFNSRN